MIHTSPDVLPLSASFAVATCPLAYTCVVWLFLCGRSVATLDRLQFWEQLPQATLSPATVAHGQKAIGQVLTMSSGAFILGQRELQNAMYVRPEYELLVQRMIRAVVISEEGYCDSWHIRNRSDLTK